MIAGVCAGLGQFFGIDANLVRIVFALLTLFSAGAAALVYLLAWVVVPEEGESGSIAENYMNKRSSDRGSPRSLVIPAPRPRCGRAIGDLRSAAFL